MQSYAADNNRQEQIGERLIFPDELVLIGFKVR